MSDPTTTLKFIAPPEEGVRPVFSLGSAGSKQIQRNFGFEQKEVVIENVRGKEDTVSLDTTGFQYFHEPSKHKNFEDEEAVVRDYYPESIEIIKRLTGASRVVLFDHTIRRRLPGLEDQFALRQPAGNVHVDQTFKASVARVHRHLPAAEVPKLLERRFQIINLWRPINHPAIDWPLALCDWRSVDAATDTFPVTLRYPDRDGETMGMKYNPNQKWKYLRGMTPDEIVLIKCADSIQDGSVAAFTPHTAFNDPTTPEGTPPRESIELRSLVFYD